MMSKEQAVILGIGSDFGDDQLGLIVAKDLAWQLPHCRVGALRSPIDVCDYLENARELHLVDACRGSGPPGSVLSQDWQSATLQRIRFSGTHDVDLISVLRLADHLMGLPPRVMLWGIEVADPLGATPESLLVPLSPVVAAAARELTARIVAEVESAQALAREQANHA